MAPIFSGPLRMARYAEFLYQPALRHRHRRPQLRRQPRLRQLQQLLTRRRLHQQPRLLRPNTYIYSASDTNGDSHSDSYVYAYSNSNSYSHADANTNTYSNSRAES